MNKWVLIVAILIILGIMSVPAIYFWSAKNTIQKDLDYQKARTDSIQNALVYSDTSHQVEIKKLQVLIGQKRADTVYVFGDFSSDTTWAEIKQPVARLTIDTLLTTTGLDSNLYKVPFNAVVDYRPLTGVFDYDFRLGTIREKTIINKSNIITNPPVIIKPSWFSHVQDYAIGGGVVAVIILILNTTK